MTWKNGRKKPKICVGTWFHCLRNVKMSIGAWLNGYELELVTREEGRNLMNEMQFLHIYDNIRLYENTNQFEAAMMKSDADIFWLHNEPDMMTEICIQPEVKQGRMVIHDIHDLPTLHPGLEEQLAPQEKTAIMGADACFVPTDDYIDLIDKKYGCSNKVHTTFSCPPSIFFPDSSLPKVNGILYCGQVNVPEMQSKLHYRDCMPLFAKFTQLGLASHIYNTTPNANMMPYIMQGALVMGTMRMFAAMHQYTRYDYAFCGSNVDCPEIQMCMPNKLFDCIAAGLPIICLNAKTAGKWVEDNGVGVSIQGIDNLDNVPWHDVEFWNKCRANVEKIRHEYTAEKEVAKVFAKLGI